MAVGIGRYENFQGQLEEIAGKNAYSSSNYDELSDLFDDILAETCSKWTEATPLDVQGVYFATFKPMMLSALV